jgi:hypothetical protein
MSYRKYEVSCENRKGKMTWRFHNGFSALNRFLQLVEKRGRDCK